MELSLKLDDNGNAIVVDGKPVYVDKDGKEIEVDASSLFKKITDLSGEAKGYRKSKSELKKELDAIRSIVTFEKIEELENWKKEADKNAELVANFNQKDLVDAKKVEEIKAAQNRVFEEEKKSILNSFSEKESEYQQTLKEKDDTIYNLMVSSQFARSPFFSGTDPKSILPPEIAETYFGSSFKVEQDGGKLRVTGYVDDKPVYSRKNPGELADFDEALEAIIDAYPMKDRILRSTGGGSGATGGSGDDQKGGIEGQIQKLKAQYDEAMEKNNGKLAITLKNRIFELTQKKNLNLR